MAQARKRLYWVRVADAALDDIATRAVLAIDPRPHGLFGVDLTYDRAGVPNPTEINVGHFITTPPVLHWRLD